MYKVLLSLWDFRKQDQQWCKHPQQVLNLLTDVVYLPKCISSQIHCGGFKIILWTGGSPPIGLRTLEYKIYNLLHLVQVHTYPCLVAFITTLYSSTCCTWNESFIHSLCSLLPGPRPISLSEPHPRGPPWTGGRKPHPPAKENMQALGGT